MDSILGEQSLDSARDGELVEPLVRGRDFIRKTDVNKKPTKTPSVEQKTHKIVFYPDLD